MAAFFARKKTIQPFSESSEEKTTPRLKAELIHTTICTDANTKYITSFISSTYSNMFALLIHPIHELDSYSRDSIIPK